MATLAYYLVASITIGGLIFVFFRLPEMQAEFKMVIIFAILLLDAVILRAVRRKANEKLAKRINYFKEWVNTGLVAVVLAWFVMSFVVQAFKIPSGSMMNTLKVGDYIFVAKFVYGVHVPFSRKYIFRFREPKRGEIVVFQFPPEPKKDFIKRCIAVPGDILEIKGKKVYINGEMVEEPYAIYTDDTVYPNSADLPLMYRNRDNFGPFVVPSDTYFVMGDNRDNSYDSRFWGPLERQYLKGKALLLYWPPSRIGIVR